MTVFELNAEASDPGSDNFGDLDSLAPARFAEGSSGGTQLNEYETQQLNRRLEDISKTSTGDRAIDEALTSLAESIRLPVSEQIYAVESVHAVLQDRLTDVEE